MISLTRIKFKKKYVHSALLITIAFLLASCAIVKKAKELTDTPPIMNVPEQAVRQIDVIKLKERIKKEEFEAQSVKPKLKDITLSLEECRALTLENNLDLRVKLINPTIAEESVNLEEAKFETIFNGVFRYSRTDSPQATLLDGSLEKTGVVNIGVEMPLRTGGTLSFNILDSRKKETSTWSILDPSYYTNFGASISQPLLRNAGVSVNAYRIRMAQYNSKIVDTKTKLQAIRIIANVDIIYWQLYASRKLLEIRKKQYDLSKALFEQTERFVEMGLKSKVEVMRTEASMAEKLEAIIKAENEVRVAERSLKRILNKRTLV